jgi:hypothetical protein
MEMQVQWVHLVGLLVALNISLMFSYLRSINLKSKRGRSAAKGRDQNYVEFVCD